MAPAPVPTAPIPSGGFTRIVESGRGSTIAWQDRARGETGGELVGDTPETILPLVLERLRFLNREPNTPSRQTALAITKVEEAVHWLEDRRRDRDARGVTGTVRP